MSSVICWRQSMKKSCGTDRQEPAEWPRLSKDGLSSEDLCQHPVRAPVSAWLPLPGAALIFLPVGCHQKVTIGNVEKHYSKYLGYQEKFDQHLWGVSTGPDHNLDHIEMTVHFDPGEEFVLHRLEREKRHGTVELLDSQTCRFSADVYDASEILPWLRTFIGRIVDLKCSSQYVLDMFQEDLARMDALYGGGNDVIQ